MSLSLPSLNLACSVTCRQTTVKAFTILIKIMSGHLYRTKWSEVPSHLKVLQFSQKKQPFQTMLKMEHLKSVIYYISHPTHTFRAKRNSRIFKTQNTLTHAVKIEVHKLLRFMYIYIYIYTHIQKYTHIHVYNRHILLISSL